jgi:hypothetical protein
MPIRSHVGEAAGLGLGRRYGEDCIRVRLRLPPRPLCYPALSYGVEDGGEVAKRGTISALFWVPSHTVTASGVNASCVTAKKPVTRSCYRQTSSSKPLRLYIRRHRRLALGAIDEIV